MSQLIIADLDFLERDFPSQSEVKGGKKKFGSKFRSGKATTAYSATWDASYTIGPNGAAVAGAAAGAAAGSLGGSPAEAETDVDVKVGA